MIADPAGDRMLLFVAAAFAHGVDFSAASLSVLDEDPREIWAVLTGWGVVHTVDGGDTWTWTCEEAVAGTREVYGVLALAPGEALAATAEGPVLLGPDCTVTPIPGLPAATLTDRAARVGDAFYVLGAGADEGGVWACTRDACEASLTGEGFFPKSIHVDGEVVWVTLVHEADLASELWRQTVSADGEGAGWALAHAWPDGDTDPRVLLAEGDRLLVWDRPRDPSRLPALLRSDDAGATFEVTFEAGYYTDPAPGFVVVGDELYLGSVYGARTWCSRDRGETFTEVSATAPAVRCGDWTGEHAFVCADHLADGFDIARAGSGARAGTWDRIGCLEEAEVAACDDATCASPHELYVNAGLVVGGQCDVAPDAPPVGGKPCGCGGGGGAALLLVLRRRRRA